MSFAGRNPYPARVSAALERLPNRLTSDSDMKPLSDQWFRAGAAVDPLETSEPLEGIILTRAYRPIRLTPHLQELLHTTATLTLQSNNK